MYTLEFITIPFSPQYKHAIYVQTCKLFADLERLRQEREAKDMHDRLVGLNALRIVPCVYFPYEILWSL